MKTTFRMYSLDELNEKFKDRPAIDEYYNDATDEFVKYKYVIYIKKTNSILVDKHYKIELSRCQTSKACLDWIHQLHEKSWVTPELEWEFIDLLFRLIPGKLWHGGLA